MATMNWCFAAFVLVFAPLCACRAQVVESRNERLHSQSFSVQAGLTLLENPFVFYPAVGLAYSRAIVETSRHKLAILPQTGLILLPEIETKLLNSVSLQYRYTSLKRFEASAFVGINYQLRILAYDRYQFEDNSLQNKGNLLHQAGPILGVTVGYAIIKNKHSSISPFFCLSMTKLNKDYLSDPLVGYKPTLSFGITLNKFKR